MKRTWKHNFLISCLYFLAFSVYPADAALVRTFVSIAPQKYFVEKIGGGRVLVSVLVPPGADPHTYEPKPKQMAELAQSDAYFAVGIDFEKVWLRRIAGTNPRMRIVHTDAGIEKIAMAAHRHDHKARAGHDAAPHPRHGGSPDPHVWLAPALVKIQAGHILSALIAVDPGNQLHYQANYSVFLKEIDTLDAEMKILFAGCKGAAFMVFHPSWGYFAQAYGLKQVPIEIEGKDPKPAALQALIRQAREHNIRVVFVQPQFSAKTAAMVSRQIGGQVVYVDALASDWAGNLRSAAQKFRDAFPRE